MGIYRAITLLAATLLLWAACSLELGLNTEEDAGGNGSSVDSPLIVSAKELSDEEDRNVERFKRNYLDRWLKITGTVEDVDQSSFSFEELSFWIGLFGSLEPVQGDRGRELILAASKGEKLTVVCYFEWVPIVFGQRRTREYMFTECHLPGAN